MKAFVVILSRVLMLGLLAFCAYLFMVGLCGCAACPVPNPLAPPTAPAVASQTAQAVVRSMQATDWVLSLLLIGSVLGVFAGLNGVKAGWAGLAACVVGIVLKAALASSYVYLMSGLIFMGCVLVAAASVLRKNVALKEIIKGAQKLKETFGDADKVSATLAAEQSPATQEIVQYTKADMKLSGEIQ